MLVQQDQPVTGQELLAVVTGGTDHISFVLCNGDRVFPSVAIFKSARIFQLVPRVSSGDSEFASCFKTQSESTACDKDGHVGQNIQMGDLDTYRGVAVCPSIVLLNCQTAPVDKHAQVDNGREVGRSGLEGGSSGSIAESMPPCQQQECWYSLLHAAGIFL